MSELYEKHKAWIKYAEEHHERYFMKDAKRFIEYYQNKFPKVTENEELQVWFNYYSVNVKQMLPQLSPLNVSFNIKPYGGEKIDVGGGQMFDNERACILLEDEFNRFWKQSATKYIVKLTEIDTFLTNLGVVYVGWNTELEEKEKPIDAQASVLAEKAQNGELVPGEAIIPEKEVISRNDDYFIKRVNPKEFMLDPTSVHPLMFDEGFSVMVLKMTVEQAKRSPYWSALENKSPTDTVFPEQKDSKALKVYKMKVVYDKDEMKRFIYYSMDEDPIATQDILIWPFVYLRFNLEPEGVYPASDFKYYETQVQERAFYRTALANSLNRRLARKVIYDRSHIGEEELKKLKSSVDMEYVGIDIPPQKRLEDLIKIEEQAPVNVDVYNLTNMVDSEIQRVSSVNAMRLGDSKGQVATVAGIVQGAFQDAIVEKQDIVKDFCRQICEKVIELIKTNLDESKMFRLEDGEWQPWGKEDVQHARYTVEVDFSSPTTSDMQAKREENIVNMLLNPNVQQSLERQGKTVNVEYLLESYLTIIKTNKDVEKLLIDIPEQPDNPLVENELMMNGKPAEVAEGQDHEKHLMVHMRFMSTPVFRSLPLQIQQMFMEHIQATKQAMASDMPVSKGGSTMAVPEMARQSFQSGLGGQPTVAPGIAPVVQEGL